MVQKRDSKISIREFNELANLGMIPFNLATVINVKGF